ncbi:MAG: prenyltransferase/squalene oxidase repeat-containing protein [Pirellulaceae bacterium]
MTAYLQELTLTLGAAVGELSDEQRQRQIDFFIRSQQADGGFMGREGESDLYYTGFATRALAILGELQGGPAEQLAGFLESRIQGQETVIDFLSLIYSAFLLDSAASIDVFQQAPESWSEQVASTLESLRREDGGYAKSPEGAASSTYHSFLVLLCLQLLEQPLPQPGRLLEFIQSQAGNEGGFREHRVSKRAGTNPTAAAMGILRILGGIDDTCREQTVDFLADMQVDEGGLRANTRIPIGDILSTFTGILTLRDLGAMDQIDTSHALQYVHSLQQPDGGSLGAEWDQVCDVEYSFYGMGALALLNQYCNKESHVSDS